MKWIHPESTTQQAVSFKDTEFYREWKSRVKEGRANDYLIALTPSSKTGVSGTGKTTCATALAKSLDDSDTGFDAEQKATLDAGTLAYDVLPEVGEGSALIFDEAQGAPGTDSVNTRRGMTSEAIDAINAILANRDKRVTLILVGQQLGMLDTALYPLLDAWFLIRYEPTDDQGPLLTHHKVHIEDYNLRNPDLRTPAIEDLTWPKIPKSDPDYEAMEKMKQEAKVRGGDGDDGEPAIPSGLADMPTRDRDALITDLYRNYGVDRQRLAEAAGVTPQRISQISQDD